ncbi:MAG: ABC transporter permease, partial [Rhodospirillaceae bacterium]
LPYLSASLLVWNLITTVATEAVMIFISSHSHLTSHNRPRFLYVLLAMWRTIVIWLHVSPIYIVIGMIYGTLPGIGGTLDIFSGLALLLVGIFLLVINCTWLLTILAILAVRFRDVPMIVTNLINAAFWLTPVIYYPEQLGEHAYFLNFNPLTHLMEVVRSPLMGEPASMLNYLVCTIAAVVGSLAALVFFSKFRARITYWI